MAANAKVIVVSQVNAKKMNDAIHEVIHLLMRDLKLTPKECKLVVKALYESTEALDC